MEAIKSRRSIRRFEPEPLPPEVVEELLEAARWAPSAGNRQPWHFYVVGDERKRRELVEAAGGQEFIAEAPIVIVVCADAERSAERYADRGRNLYCIQDTAAAIQNILLAAEDRDLGTCWIGAFDEEACARVVDVPDRHRPVAMIPVGVKAIRPKPTPRRDLDEIVTYL
ncbi:MAG: nitroreductase family protein [Bacillota bacterium]